MPFDVTAGSCHEYDLNLRVFFRRVMEKSRKHLTLAMEFEAAPNQNDRVGWLLHCSRIIHACVRARTSVHMYELHIRFLVIRHCMKHVRVRMHVNICESRRSLRTFSFVHLSLLILRQSFRTYHSLTPHSWWNRCATGVWEKPVLPGYYLPPEKCGCSFGRGSNPHLQP